MFRAGVRSSAAVVYIPVGIVSTKYVCHLYITYVGAGLKPRAPSISFQSLVLGKLGTCDDLRLETESCVPSSQLSGLGCRTKRTPCVSLHTPCGISRGEATATVSGKETRRTCIIPTYQDLPRHVLIGGAGPEVDEQEHEDGGREEKREDAPPTREGPDFSVQDLVSLAGLPVFRPMFILAFHGVSLWRRSCTKETRRGANSERNDGQMSVLREESGSDW